MSRNIPSRLARRGSALAAMGCAAVLVVGCGVAPAGSSSGGAPASHVEVVPMSAVTSVAAAATSAASAQRAGRVRAYGDSVMLGATYALKKKLKAKVDAGVSTQSWAVLGKVRKAAKKGKIKGPVVIHTGTNGTVDKALLLKVTRKVPTQVVLVTAKANRSWIPAVNATLRSVAATRANVTLFDWAAYASGHGAWFWGDGIHLRPAGAKAYAKGIARALQR